MQRERRTLSVPTISYENVDQQQDLEMVQQHGFLGTLSPQALGGPGAPGTLHTPSAWPPHPHPGQAPSPLGHGQSSGTLGKPSHMARSRSSSTSSLTTPTGATPNPQKKKIVTACQRCRTRKIRCDGALPACRSCIKAGASCIEVDRSGDNNMPRSHVLELENRIKWLEDIVRTQCPDIDLSIGPLVDLRSRPSPPAIRIVTTGPDFNQPPQSMSSASSPVYPTFSPSSTCATPVSFEFSSPGASPGHLQPTSPLTFSDVGPSPAPSPGPSSPLLLAQDTLAHEVGLLSLTSSEEPKFLGSSSGVSFARMVFADIQDIDFPLADNGLRDMQHTLGSSAEPAQLPSAENCRILARTYFETVHLPYPFLHQPAFDDCLSYCLSRQTRLPRGFLPATAQFHVFLVLSIGAHIMSTRSDRDWNSKGYYATALLVANDVSLAGSLQGAQNALLLAMRSLYAPPGSNLWYLSALVMATCIDLGLHRKCQLMPGEQAKAALRRRVFWCAYALDRNLGIALGRPFSIRDELIDVELPQDTDNDEELSNLPPLNTHAIPPSIATSRAIFSNSIFLFRITKLMSFINTTMYRVSAPNAPWGTDLSGWQMKAYQQLHELQDHFRSTLGGIRRGPGTNPTLVSGGQLVELKLHEAIQLLFRPRSTFTRSPLIASQQCFNSAIETIRLFNRPKRYNEPPYPYTRLMEHSIFLSGITMLYCHRTCREVRETAGNEFLTEEIRACSNLLADLSHLWPTAKESKGRFDALAQVTLAYSSATSSSRMLSPHGGARRASGGSVRAFSMESQMLGVPPVWYGVGASSGTVGWMEETGWEEHLAPEDIMIGVIQDAPTEIDILGLINDDTPMWGMDPEQHQQAEHAQR